MNNKMQNDRPLSIGGLRRRKGLCRFFASVAAAMFLFVSTAPAFADPTSLLGGNAVLTGMHRATLDSNGANAAAFSSSSASAVLDWSKFNIGSGQSMSFNGASTTFFNLVDGAAGKSQIDGIINGSGNVWVINPAGIAFGAGSSVNVGGLFAAAAGNIENAAALRDGTAMTPAFSSFAGTVDASKGSFTADQVALMGKTVTTAGGDFSGARGLSVTASTGAMTVDEVEGGKVSVNISDFAADDAEVLLGDLKIGGSLSIMSTGKIATQREAPESSVKGRKMLAAAHVDGREDDGDIDISSYDIDILAADIDIDGKLWSKQGHVGVEALGTLNVNAEVEAADYVSLQAGGDVSVNANVTAMNGNIDISSGGALTVERGATIEAKGDSAVVTLKGTTEFFSAGDVTVAGAVKASGENGEVHVYSAQGMLSQGDLKLSGDVSADRVFLAAGLNCEFNEVIGDYYPMSTYGAGMVAIDGNVTGASRVLIGTDSSDVTIGKNAVVKTTGDTAALDIAAGFSGYKAEGSVNVYGSLEAEGAGNIELSAGLGFDGLSTGNVNVKEDGSVVAGGTATFYSGYDSSVYHDPYLIELGGGLTGVGGFVDLSGTVEAGSGIYANSVMGVKGSGTVTSADGEVHMNGGLQSVNFSGKIVANTARFDATQYKDYGYAANVFLLNENNAIKKIDADGYSIIYRGGSVEVGHASSLGEGITINTDGDLKTSGLISSATDVTLKAYDGNVVVGSDVKANGSKSSVSITSLCTQDDGSCNVFVNGSVSAESEVFMGANVLKNESGQGVLVHGKGNVEVNAEVKSNGSVYALTADGNVIVGEKGKVVSSGKDGKIFLTAAMREGKNACGSVEVKDGGVVRTMGDDASVLIAAAEGSKSTGDVTVHKGGKIIVEGKDSQIDITAAAGRESCGDVVIDGDLLADAGSGSSILGYAGFGDQANGIVKIGGTAKASQRVSFGSALKGGYGGIEVKGTGIVSSEDRTMLMTGNGDIDVRQGGVVSATGDAGTVYLATGIYEQERGNVNLDGTAAAGKDMFLMAGVDDTSSGNLSFGAAGSASAGSGVYAIVKNGSVSQAANSVSVKDGYVEAKQMNAAMSGNTINMVVHNGSIGSGKYDFVAVSGKAFVKADGNISLAAANGQDLKGGSGVGTVQTDFGTITFGDPNGDSNMIAGGDLSVYTAGKIESSGILQADGDLTVTASSFGDMSYLRAGGKLTVNNVGHPSHPQIAYFESVDGKEPRINNLPNDMVIFVDGRLAGGNLQIINKFGATEAFPVSTPELKSEQGIFGNPVFLHGDLDVANPMAVGNVDYMLQEIPRLTLASDFPLEIDKSVNTAGLNPKDVYRFGQHTQVAEEKPQAEQEEKKDDKASAEKSAEPKVAMR